MPRHILPSRVTGITKALTNKEMIQARQIVAGVSVGVIFAEAVKC